MTQLGIKKLLRLISLRGLIGAIALLIYYFGFFLFLSFIPRHQTDSQMTIFLGPNSISEATSQIWHMFPRALGLSLLWSTSLVVMRSEKPSLDLILAVSIPMLASLPSIFEIPNILTAAELYFPGNFFIVLLYSLVLPASLLFSSATTWLAVKRLGLKNS